MVSPSIEREDNLVHFATCHALQQRSNLQITRPHTVHRRDDTAQHVVQTAILPRVLNGHDAANVFYHTDGAGIAGRVAANLAQVRVGDIVAHTTIFHLRAQAVETVGQSSRCRCRLSQQVHHQSQSSATAHTREFGHFANGALKKLG